MVIGAEGGAVASRVLAAAVGGYAVTYAASGAVAAALTLPRVDAVYLVGSLSFAIYPSAVLWAFAARTARRAWGVLAAATGICATIIVLARAL